MYCYYDLKAIADQLHQEKLREAQERHLAKQARACREPCDPRWLGLVWRNPLAMLRGAEFSE